MRIPWLFFGSALILMSAVGAATAVPIDYIFTGTGTGTVNGNAFNDSSFTITAVADTSGITSGGGEFRNTPTSVTFTEGANTATLIDFLIIENTASPGFMGWGNSISPFDGEDLTNTIFETYGLNTALGPITGGLSVAPGAFETSVGTLDFTSSPTALSFQATAVPEPITFSLFGAGLVGAGLIRRRKRAKQV